MGNICLICTYMSAFNINSAILDEGMDEQVFKTANFRLVRCPRLGLSVECKMSYLASPNYWVQIQHRTKPQAVKMIIR